MNFLPRINKKILVASVLAACVLPAFAAPVTFDFANLRSQATDFKPSEILNQGYWMCTGADICSSNLNAGLLGGDLKFTMNGITATATGYYKSGNSWQQVSVVQDAEPAYDAARQIGAGLGVYHKTGDNSDDNITAHERLVLTFDAPVKLESLMMRSDGHNTSWVSNSTFLFNGNSTKLAGSITGMNLTANSFVFEYGGAKADQFYLGGMVVSRVSPVPEAETYGMLLIGLAGLAALRRKKSA